MKTQCEICGGKYKKFGKDGLEYYHTCSTSASTQKETYAQRELKKKTLWGRIKAVFKP